MATTYVVGPALTLFLYRGVADLHLYRTGTSAGLSGLGDLNSRPLDLQSRCGRDVQCRPVHYVPSGQDFYPARRLA